MTKKQNKLCLDVVYVGFNYSGSQLLLLVGIIGELFITFVGACTDQLNQNLWEQAQTLVNFKKIVITNTNHRAIAL